MVGYADKDPLDQPTSDVLSRLGASGRQLTLGFDVYSCSAQTGGL